MTISVSRLTTIFDDQISAGAKAAADAMDRMGASATSAGAKVDSTTDKATKAGASIEALTNRNDDLSRANAKLAQAEAQLADFIAKRKQAQDQTAVSVEAMDRAQASLTARVADAKQKVIDLTNAHDGHTDAVKKNTEASGENAGVMGKVADAFGVHTYQVTQATEELHKFVDQVLAGGSPLKAMFYQLPNITTALGGMGNIMKVVAGFMLGTGGLVVGAAAVVAGFTAVGVYAEHQQSALAELSQQLRATRTDYEAMAQSATLAARQAANGGLVSRSDATAAANTFAGVPTVSSGQLAGLIQQATDLAAEMGAKVPEAAKVMADAMADPAKAAQDFASKGLFGIHQGFVQTLQDVEAQQGSLAAYNQLMGQVNQATAGAAMGSMTDLQKALHNLHQAFIEPIDGAKSFAAEVGDAVDSAATRAINNIARIVTALRTMPINGNDGAPTAAPAVSGSASSVSTAIDAAGARLGAPADVISLAHRIAPVESSHGQFNADGSVVQGSVISLGNGQYTRAQGAMQVLPSNANGNDLSTVDGNVTASEQLLIDYYNKYGGNQILVAMAYNWGPANVDAFLARKVNSVPQSVQDYVQQVTGGVAYSPTTTAAKFQQVDSAERTGDTGYQAQLREQTNAVAQLTAAQKALDDLHNAGSVTDSDYAAQTAALTQRLSEHKAALLDLRDPMQQLAHQQDLAIQQSATYSDAERAMVQADQSAEDAAHKMGEAHASAADKAAAEAQAQAILTNRFNDQVAAIDRQTAGQNKLIAGYDGTTGTLDSYIRAEQAAEKVRATSTDDTAEQARQFAILKSAEDAAANSATDLATAQGLLGKQQELDTLNAQIALVGTNSNDAARQLAALAEQQDLVRRYGSAAAAANSNEAQMEVQLAARTEDARLALAHQQQVVNDVTNDLSNMADTIADDVTQAFVQGGGKAVSFGSILQGVETQVISLLARLALINPALNALDGGTRTTLGDVGGLLGSSGASGGSSLLGGVSSLFSGSGLSGIGGNIASGLGNVWNGITGGSAATVLTGHTLVNAGGVLSSSLSSAAPMGLWNGGSLLSGFGSTAGLLGIGGSILPGLMSGNIGQAAAGGIGAGIGTAILPGIGTALGGLAGNLLGGLFGGHPKNPYTIDNVGVTNGQLSVGQTWNQAQNDGITAQLHTDVATINSTLAAVGASFTGSGQIGSVRSDPNNKNPALQSTTLQQEIQGVGLTSADATFAKALKGISSSAYQSVSAFTSALTSLKQVADTVDALGVSVRSFNSDGTVVFDRLNNRSDQENNAISSMLGGKSVSVSDLQTTIAAADTFFGTTMPNLLSATTAGTSSFQNQLSSIATSYGAAITQAQEYGISTDALVAKQKELTDATWEQATTSLGYQTMGLQQRQMAASGDQEGADLLGQHVSAEQERTAFDASWEDIYGSAYTQAQGYGDALAQLTATQSAERLAIEQKYEAAATEAAAEAAKQQVDATNSVAGVFSNLNDYAQGLLTSSQSPLSASDQFNAANDNFNSVVAAAQGGDYTALQKVQDAATTLLSTAQTYQGSGTAYADTFNRVRSSIGGLAAADPTSLITSAINEMTDTSNANQQQANALLTSILGTLQQTARKAA